MNKLTPRRPSAAPKRAAAAGSFSLALSLLLIFQTFAFLSPVSAQRRAALPGPTVATVDLGGPQTAVPQQQPPDGAKAIAPQKQAITVLQPVNMRLLSSQQEFAPQTAAVKEIRSINPPQPIDRGRMGVAIPEAFTSGLGRTTAQPLAPVPSVHGQSPPTSRTFKSDSISLLNIPPDTMGAVGDNHVVTTTNEKVVIHDRKGVVLSTVTLNAFWATAIPTAVTPANQGAFDPKIFYDRFNDRYIFVTQGNARDATSATLVAVTQTNDPTGTWNRYAIDTDSTATAAGGIWADYPSVGFNKNWIAVSINLFGFGNQSGFKGTDTYVLDKAAAYNNTLGVVSTFRGLFADCLAALPADQPTLISCGATYVPAITEDNTTETLYLVEDWDSPGGQLRVSKITGTPAAPSMTAGTQFPQSPNSWRGNALIVGTTRGYIPQRDAGYALNTTRRIVGNDSRVQNAVLRNGSLWTTHHVMLPTTPLPAGTPVGTTLATRDNHTAVQWWEIDPTIENSLTGTPPTQRGLIEDPTSDNCHNGAGGLAAGCTVQGQNFAYPTISVNQNDDVLIGYTRFSNLTYPKAAYSFRAAADTANTMRDSQTYREGQFYYDLSDGVQVRWGDYSATMVDPTNDTDFWTIQEYADELRELLGAGNGFFTSWSTWWALVKPTSTTTTAGNLIISEFRLRGPAGTVDEFVELYNPANTPLTVTTTDGSDGWALAFTATGAAASALTAIPNGTTIPARGHLLIAVNNTGANTYSLKAYPNTPVRLTDTDASYFANLGDNGGLAIFRTGNVANMNAATRMDSVGFQTVCTTTPASIFKEGNCIPNIAITTPAGNYSFVRRQSGASLTSPGAPQDTNDNAADFIFVDPVIETLTVQPMLGAAGPQNLDSPVVEPNIGVDRFDNTIPIGSPPNRVRRLCTPMDPLVEECNPARSALGTISMRRRVTNYTGADVSRLRWRLTLTTTAPAPSTVGTADLRAITSSDIIVYGQTVKGTTLEQPPTQTVGGGWNASWSVALPTPLAPGASMSVQFLFGVQVGGTFSVLVQTEALP
jgi:hypothetical protein